MKGDFIVQMGLYVQELMASIEEHPVLGPVTKGTATKSVYEEFLKGSYHYVRYTKPLLTRAAKALQACDQESGETCAAKSGEEDGHERWLLEDMEALGADASALLRSQPYWEHRAYRALIAAWPYGVLVAALVLESFGDAYAQRSASNLRARSRIRAVRRGEGLSFLQGHGVDEEHIVELKARLRRIKDPKVQRHMVELTPIIGRLYLGFFREPDSRRNQRSKARVACRRSEAGPSRARRATRSRVASSSDSAQSSSAARLKLSSGLSSNALT
ncbi:iron-containing redox enzyme family protein [Sorangium sp. So ce448]